MDEDILRTLEDLPKDLPATFRRILCQLDQSRSASPIVAKKIFEIVAAAQRLFTLEELREAISITPGDTSLHPSKLVNDVTKALACSSSLLVVDEELSTVHFAHPSVKQHIISYPTKLDMQKYHASLSVAYSKLGEIGVTCFDLDIFESKLKRTDKTAGKISQMSQDASDLVRAGDLARRILKSQKTPGYDVGRALRVSGATAGPTVDSRLLGTLTLYAQNNWLYHKRTFKISSAALKPVVLLKQLIHGNKKTVQLPWTSREYNEVKGGFLDIAIGHKHSLLSKRALLTLYPHETLDLSTSSQCSKVPQFAIDRRDDTLKQLAPFFILTSNRSLIRIRLL